MTACTIVPYAADHADRIVELSLDAWTPVFASFKTVLGDDLYQRVHPDWRNDQATSVRAALDTNETWVAIADDVVMGFVNVVFDQAEQSGEIYMIAVDPPRPATGDCHCPHRVRAARDAHSRAHPRHRRHRRRRWAHSGPGHLREGRVHRLPAGLVRQATRLSHNGGLSVVTRNRLPASLRLPVSHREDGTHASPVSSPLGRQEGKEQASSLVDAYCFAQ
jgi:hypothetical protein